MTHTECGDGEHHVVPHSVPGIYQCDQCGRYFHEPRIPLIPTEPEGIGLTTDQRDGW